jgi:fructoselysine 6-phosphate deglycase
MPLDNATPSPEEIKAKPNPNYLDGTYLEGVLTATYASGEPVAARLVTTLLARHHFTSIYLVGAGGSHSYMEPIKYLLDRATDLRVERITATEFETRRPKPVGPDALVLLTSHNGDTEDTVVAARWAKTCGAVTVALTAGETSPLAKACDHLLPYSRELPGMPKLMMAYLFAAHLIGRLGSSLGRELVEQLRVLPAQLTRIKDAERERGMELARRYKDEGMYYILSAGILSALNYQYSICIFNEMLWINASDIHSGEFRHGPFEMVDETMPYIFLLDNTDSRKTTQRALDFTRRYTDKVITFDAGRYPEVSPYLSPFVIGVIWYWFAHTLSVLREHPLGVRRYMWKVDY